MNKNQKTLYKALETIANSILFLEDAQNIIEEQEMTKEEVKQVVEKFSERISEFDSKELYVTAYNFEGYANNVITSIVHKLKDEDQN